MNINVHNIQSIEVSQRRKQEGGKVLVRDIRITSGNETILLTLFSWGGSKNLSVKISKGGHFYMTYNRSMDSDPDVEYGTWSCLDCIMGMIRR